jgi:tetratricopeptide (TPR) repeat protein
MAASFADAVKLHQAGDLAQAERLYRAVMEAAPQHADALRLLGVLMHQRGDAASATDLIGRAIASDPANAKAHDNLGFVLTAIGKRDEAVACFQRAIALQPSMLPSHLNLGRLLADLGRHGEAIASYRQALVLQEANAGAHLALGILLLKSGEPRDAIAHFDRGYALDPNSTALAHKAVALAEAGDNAASDALVGLDTLVCPASIGDAHGFADLQAFNDDLAAYVVENATLRPVETTVNGLDTKELFVTERPAALALKRFAEAQIASRLATLPHDAAHPFAAGKPTRYRIESWGVRMWQQGYQVPHIHHKAWLSGVYYVRLPDAVERHADAHEGWIEFGRGPAELYRRSAPRTRLIRPVPGTMITFPSYVWHRTVPFDSTADRISIAFDVVPES